MAGMIPPAVLEQIRSANDIVELIGSYIPLKRAGANFVALCPFHKEKSPSFNVNPHRQIFHCFGCHKGGDVIKFLREYENLDFLEAVRRLAERAHIPIQFDAHVRPETRQLKDLLLQMHEQIAQRWQTALAGDAGGQIARDYLKKRGVSGEMIQRFRIGFAPEAWDDTVNWARSKSYDLKVVEQAGLILHKEETGRHYDRFRGRLMFPICDEQGRVIAFSGRVLSGDEKTAKYVNSPETPIFTKGRVFFGLDKSKRAILDRQRAIVCEGQLDLIACFQAGVENVVAPQGTALTADHARILKRYVDEVILCFDADNAGQNAAVRSLDSLLAAGLSIRVAEIPAPHDPDSFIREFGRERFEELIDHAAPFFDFLLDRLCRVHDARSDRGRAAIVREMGTALKKTGSQVMMEDYERKIGARLGVSALATRSELNKISASVRESDEPEIDSSSPPARKISARESRLLELLFQNAEYAEWVGEHWNPDWISDSLLREIITRRIAAHRECTWTGVAEFLSLWEDRPDAQEIISRFAASPAPIPNPQQQLHDTLKGIRNDAIDRQMQELKSQLADPGLPESLHLEILQKIQQLRAAKLQEIPKPEGD